MVLQEAACGLGDGGCVAGAARQLPNRDLCGRLVSGEPPVVAAVLQKGVISHPHQLHGLALLLYPLHSEADRGEAMVS